MKIPQNILDIKMSDICKTVSETYFELKPAQKFIDIGSEPKVIDNDPEPKVIYSFPKTFELPSIEKQQDNKSIKWDFYANKEINSILELNWYESNKGLQFCLIMANEVLKRYGKDRIFSLGQSPAWFVKAIEIISNKQKTSVEVGHIPFSGKFYALNSDDSNLKIRRYSCSLHKGSDRLRPEHEHKYRLLLEKMQLSPKTIIENKIRYSKKTVILEHVESGESLASFLSILFKWAEELNIMQELKNSLSILVFVFPEQSLTTIVLNDVYNKLSHPGFMIKCDVIKTSNPALISMANGKDIGINSDRLIPNYPYRVWNLPPKPLKNLILREKIIKKLITVFNDKSIEEQNKSMVLYKKKDYEEELTENIDKMLNNIFKVKCEINTQFCIVKFPHKATENELKKCAAILKNLGVGSKAHSNFFELEPIGGIDLETSAQKFQQYKSSSSIKMSKETKTILTTDHKDKSNKKGDFDIPFGETFFKNLKSLKFSCVTDGKQLDKKNNLDKKDIIMWIKKHISPEIQLSDKNLRMFNSSNSLYGLDSFIIECENEKIISQLKSDISKHLNVGTNFLKQSDKFLSIGFEVTKTIIEQILKEKELKKVFEEILRMFI